ncbi:hypothetical protein MXB_119 [Myxobolus squamalis]|nr:hypothetical protein MXB_119 [Myxobolus squamalis]
MRNSARFVILDEMEITNPETSQTVAPYQNDVLCKLFVGNVNKSTTEEDFRTYFEKYGKMRDLILMKDNVNPSQNRGFGFVTPELVEVTDKILLDGSHQVDGRDLDIKRALPKDIEDPLLHMKTPRIFVGGLPHNLTEEDISNFFTEKYGYMGTVKEVLIKKERQTGKPRGFCFVSFDNPHVVDKIMVEMRFPVINNKRCQVKKADPGIPITGVPPSQLTKYAPRPTSMIPKTSGYGRGQPGLGPQNQQVGIGSGGNMGTPTSYDYNGYASSNPNMVAYPQSNAYYNFYQNQANMASQYQAPANPVSYSAPYGYPDQRNIRPSYQRSNYSQNINRARPY